MDMKKLPMFIRFDWDAFVEKKEISVTGVTEWTTYETHEHAGTLLEVCITKDETDYNAKDGEVISNVMEKFKVKVKKDVTVSVGDKIRLFNPVAPAYGKRKMDGSWSNYKNQLSVTCDDIEIL